MCLIAKRIAARTASGLMAAVVLAVTAAADDALLRQLESATQQEHQALMADIATRLESEPPDPAYDEYIMTSLAATLAGEWVLQYGHAHDIGKALSRYRLPLPEPAMDSLLSALDHRAMLNRWGATLALAALSPNDARRPRAIDALSSLLDQHDHQHTRTSAAEALSSLGRDAPLPDRAIRSLINAALTDDYITVRIDAADALSYQAIDRDLAMTVSESLVKELIKPTEITNRASGLIYFRQYAGRAMELLGRLYEPPYPAHVVDLWISQANGVDYQTAIEHLRAAVLRGELSPAQHEDLLTAARNSRKLPQRLDVYATAFAGTTAVDIDQAVAVFDAQSSPSSRLAAAHQIHSYYRESGVPAKIADIAATHIGEPIDAELFQVAAFLLLDAVDADVREPQVFDGLLSHADDPNAYGEIVGVLNVEQLERLLLLSAMDSAYPDYFRQTALIHFEALADRGRSMSRELQDTLENIAVSSDDYQVSQAAGRALAARGSTVPVRTRLANRQNQSAALFSVFAVLVIVNVSAGIGGLLSVFVMPLRTKDGGRRVAKRTGLVIGWLALSCGMLFLLVIALVGFIGHNSAPPPGQSLQLNLPLYVGTPIYLLIAWLAMKRARRKAPISAAKK